MPSVDLIDGFTFESNIMIASEEKNVVVTEFVEIPQVSTTQSNISQNPVSGLDEVPQKQTAKQDKIHHVPVEKLKTSEFSRETYGDAPSPSLVASIAAEGVLVPLLVNFKNQEVISGNTRLAVVKQLKKSTVPVIYINEDDPLVIQEYTLETNRHRERTPEQKVREFMAYKKIESARAKERQRTNKPPTDEPVQKCTQADQGKAREKAAEKVGMSGVQLERGEKVLNAIATLKAENGDQSKSLLDKLNKSINAAYRAAVDLGYIDKPAAKIKAKSSADTTKRPKKQPEAKSEKLTATQPPATANESGSPYGDDEFPKIDSHKRAMNALDRVIAFVEALDPESITDGMMIEWQETIDSLSGALGEAGILNKS